MKPGKFTHTIAVILSSISSLFAHGTEEKAEPAKTKFSKKSDKSADDRSGGATSISFIPSQLFKARSEAAQRYPWKSNIVTTIFWIGEQPSGNNLMPNRTSCMGQTMDEKATVVSTIQIPLTETTTFQQNSHRDRIHFTVRFPTTIRRTLVIGLEAPQRCSLV